MEKDKNDDTKLWQKALEIAGVGSSLVGFLGLTTALEYGVYNSMLGASAIMAFAGAGALYIGKALENKSQKENEKSPLER